MRRLFTLILTLSLGAATLTSAHAQTAAYAELSEVDASNFPQVSALLDVFDASGQFVSGLQPSDLVIYEDGQARDAGAIIESATPVQIVVAINPGPALAVRDSNGAPRFDFIVSALGAWVNALPTDARDDLSLISLSGTLISHAAPKDWLVSLQSFKPDFRNSAPNLQTLSIALDTVAAQAPQPGMKRAVLFITPHMDDPTIDSNMAPLVKKAIDAKIRVFVWFVDAEEFNTSPSANAFKLLTLQTNGSFFTFSGKETFPDLNAYFAPLRHIYTVTYTSGLRNAGTHSLGLYVETSQGSIPALDKEFTMDVQPPNVFFVAPPSQITRQPPADDPYNPDVLTPSQQPLEVIIEFPDGHPRAIKRTTLYVDGQKVAEYTTAPFEHFLWDINAYTESGLHDIAVEVEDELGLTKTSVSTSVAVTVIPAPSGMQAMLARYRSYVILGAIGIAGIALMAILVFSRAARRTSTIDRATLKKHLEDPLTQPVSAITEPVTKASKKVKTQPRKPLVPTWTQPKLGRIQVAPAYLIRLTKDGEPASVAPLPIVDKELTFGTDPVQAMRVLDDPSIAPLHARIKNIENGTFMIYDHGSVAGTWVNFEPVTREGRRLQNGDRIHFGGLVYRFDQNQASAESEPTVVRG